MEAPQINIIVPLFNEEQVFSELISRLKSLMDASQLSISAILIDDGSTDNTSNLMSALSLEDDRFSSVFLSRNFGHQMAISAGLSHVDATKAALIIDGDLQDPPELLDEFYKYIKEGYDVVFAIRKNRKENFIIKMAYGFFYRLLKRISYIQFPLDSGDFSLISTKVVNHINQMPEQSRFLRGMRSWVGYKQIGVEYERENRHSGKSKYSLRKLLSLALNGIFNFSEYPIKFITNLGIFSLSSAIIYFIITVIKKYTMGTVPEGFTALLFVIILFAGVQLIAIGVIGEYVLRVFFQVKNRPLFIISKIIKNKKETTDQY